MPKVSLHWPTRDGIFMPNTEICLLTERCQHVSQFSGVDETLTLAIECFERLHKVGECSNVGFAVDGLVDWKNLFELVLLLTFSAFNHKWHIDNAQ